MQLSAEGIGLWQCQELQREFLYMRVVVVWLRGKEEIQGEEFKAKEFKELCPRSGSPGIYLEDESSHKDMM